ncbi:MAG: hypothetical protein JZU63_01395, partial [Rhodoferax sp.]|nr:hypothetical protein [Rhodoferax sp.]
EGGWFIALHAAKHDVAGSQCGKPVYSHRFPRQSEISDHCKHDDCALGAVKLRQKFVVELNGFNP